MTLTFSRLRIEQLLAHARAAPKNNPLYDDPETAKPGLWLVGDQGVYFMSNGEPGLLKPGHAIHHIVAHAKESDPENLPFDEWWEVKNMSFGGDDGCEFFAADDVEAALATYPAGVDFKIRITPKTMAVVSYQKA